MDKDTIIASFNYVISKMSKYEQKLLIYVAN